jgi:hypothetical protein
MDAWTLGLTKWMTFPSSLKRLTSSIPGMFVAPSFLSAAESLTSDWAADDRDAAFFLRRTAPFPPVEAEAPPNRLAIIFARASAISVSLGIVYI